ncbi:hypothetical protein CAPTEDRAFT_218179 [Capitella teleta]|uniref:Uncharacterized protein n=1 Tax=Capitella teleta TaxID=283909 RepID=R7T6P8_CAPTE|nr:hypothetical protein CAPTEDRAFT_218179 [Capitella teleta]|eukprot:ELT89058.1 hypothetical protein CAPTEDRAFT_218179 [Capitella teleta]
MRGTPDDIVVITVHMPTTDYEDEDVEEAYEQVEDATRKGRGDDYVIVMGEQGEDDEAGKYGLGNRNDKTTNAKRVLQVKQAKHYKHMVQAEQASEMHVEDPVGDGAAKDGRERRRWEKVLRTISNRLRTNDCIGWEQFGLRNGNKGSSGRRAVRTPHKTQPTCLRLFC